MGRERKVARPSDENAEESEKYDFVQERNDCRRCKCRCGDEKAMMHLGGGSSRLLGVRIGDSLGVNGSDIVRFSP
jgi:hypothetical protein